MSSQRFSKSFSSSASVRFVGGRVLATLLGLLIFNIPGAIVGFVLGSIFDKAVIRILQENLTGPAANSEAVKTVFMQLLFTALGQLAKADGRVSEEEIAHTEALIKDFSLDADERKKATSWFQEGVKQQGHFRDLLQQFNAMSRLRPELKQVMLEALISLAMADGELDQGEETLLLEIAQGLGINQRAFRQLLNMLKGQQGFQHSAPNSIDQLAEAYKALGVTEQDSDKDIKKAYRKLMSQHHPDKLMAQGVPEDAIKLATEKSQAIQGAYEVIKKSRR